MMDGWIMITSGLSMIMVSQRNERNLYVYEHDRKICVGRKAFLGQVCQDRAFVDSLIWVGSHIEFKERFVKK